MVERIAQTELCPKCNKKKSIREFFVFLQGQYTEGGATLRERKVNCRKCRKSAAEKIWRREHPERVRQNNKNYYNRKRMNDDE